MRKIFNIIKKLKLTPESRDINYCDVLLINEHGKVYKKERIWHGDSIVFNKPADCKIEIKFIAINSYGDKTIQISGVSGGEGVTFEELAGGITKK